MDEQEFARSLNRALGEPPNPVDTLHRLERCLSEPTRPAASEREPGHPKGMALVAAALTLLVLAGLLATQVLRQRPAAAPAASPPSAAFRPPAAAAGCLANQPTRLIVIHLATQQLIAYENGCPLFSTPVTTGRLGFRTPTGTFHVLYKSPSQRLTSPWPPGNPGWYPSVIVQYYMAVADDGLALHSADWEPPSDFGAGSQNGPQATHGQVNLQGGPARQLYEWAPVGTTVIIDDSGSP